MTLHKIILDHRWTLLALLGLVVLNYAAAVHSGYMIDDYLFLEGRYAAGYGGYLDFLVRTESQHYSPLYFAVNYFLFEYLRELPQLMTVVNMVLFYLNLVMFFLLTKMWTKSIPLASLTVLLMAMHPFNAFPITYRTANFIFYGALFQQLSLYFIWHAWHQTPGIRWARTWSLLFFSAALLSNEWAILMPLYALLVLSVFVDAKDLPKTLKSPGPCSQ